MSPTVLRVSGRAIERNGVSTVPRAMVSTCEVQGCADIACFGDSSGGKFETWCSVHVPPGFLPPTKDRAGQP